MITQLKVALDPTGTLAVITALPTGKGRWYIHTKIVDNDDGYVFFEVNSRDYATSSGQVSFTDDELDIWMYASQEAAGVTWEQIVSDANEEFIARRARLN